MEEKKPISKKRYDSLGPANWKAKCERCGRYLYGKSERQALNNLEIHKNSKSPKTCKVEK